ncbi:hypothetical protein NX059_004498 [Plenodomus lindquistii]|nr:hypothetical protein NX059_004498 [Plenodomus lindquistii]
MRVPSGKGEETAAELEDDGDDFADIILADLCLIKENERLELVQAIDEAAGSGDSGDSEDEVAKTRQERRQLFYHALQYFITDFLPHNEYFKISDSREMISHGGNRSWRKLTLPIRRRRS